VRVRGTLFGQLCRLGWRFDWPLSQQKLRQSDLLVWRFAAGGAMIIAWLFLMPFSPAMPTAGLDPSWKYALNEAVARGYIFGRDVVFTIGPLAPVYTQVYSPATDTIMLVGNAIYAAGICAMFGLAAYPRIQFMALAVPIMVALCIVHDSLFIVLPFSVLLSIVRIGLPSASTLHLSPSIPAISAVAVATIAAGIEPLIKGSFIAVVFALGFLGFVVLLFQNWRFAITFAALLVLSLVGAWAFAGQPLQALPYFFSAQAPIILGYTEAMSRPGGLLAPLAYLGASAVILLSAYHRFIKERTVSRWAIVAGLAWTLFVGFKAGFVRQDGHVFTSAGVLLLLGYLVCTVVTRKVALAVGTAVIAQWFIVGGTVFPVNASFAAEQIWQTFQRTVDGLFTRVAHSEAFQQNYIRSIEAIKALEPLPHVEGTVDVYPTELSAIFANNLRWSGRPVFQSYSVYTPELQAKNVAHLVGSAAPDTVFFTFAPIDGRLPALEDSQSLLKLLSAYRITALVPPYVRMDREPDSINAQLREREERSMVVGWDQDIPVTNPAAMWVNVDARPSLLGRLARSAFKLPELEIDLTLVDGSVSRHRFIASIGRSGFIVSPYLTTAADLVYLTAGLSSARRVKSFKLVTHAPNFWKGDIAVRLTPINITPQPTARALILTQPSINPPIALSRPLQQTAALCSIDFVNDRPYQHASTNKAVDGTVRLQGWTAPPANAESSSISTWVTLISLDGKTQYFKAPLQDRSDVAVFFKRPDLKESGFSITLDLSERPGKQTINLFSVSGEAAYKCSMAVDIE
jgi:hypothetical protein